MQHESVVRARKLAPDQGGEMVAFTRQEAGWEWMGFAVTRLLPGQTKEARTRGEEDGSAVAGRTLYRRLGCRPRIGGKQRGCV